jgi:glutamine amidotransferase
MSAQVTIADYGVGNLLKVARAVSEAGGSPLVSGDATEIVKADRLILPGVGAFSHGMQGLREQGLVDAVLGFIERERPFLGICLGMQMMLSESEEFGHQEGLGLIDGQVRAIPNTAEDGTPHRIPLVGWMPLQPAPGADWSRTPLRAISPGSTAYFVHSFAAHPEDPEHRMAETDYNGRTVCAAVVRDHLIGCQFHPEMSGQVGLQLLADFVVG